MKISLLSFLLLCTALLHSDDTKYNSQIVRYSNGMVVQNHELFLADLWVADGKIIPPQPYPDVTIDVHGAIIAPGYIDIQINGGFGLDFTSDPTSVHLVASQLPKYGVTAFLPTVVSSPKSTYQEILPKLQPAHPTTPAASILGIHLEGPFFCPEKHGAHDPHVIASFDNIDDIDSFYGNLNGVKIVTLAPELKNGLEVIKYLKSKNIIVSAGHTNATYDETLAAIDAGISLATHLFNAMRPLHQREPGILGAVLTQSDFFYSIIADEQHVHPAAIQLAWKANPKGLILVTDAMAALGLPNGNYSLGMQQVTLENGAAYITGTETLAGAAVGMDQAVRNFHRATGCSLVEAIEAASLKPAQLLGIQDTKGTLHIGADADFLLLDANLNVLACYIGGEFFNPYSFIEFQ